MKIIFTIKSINLGGGSERSTIAISGLLAKRGHEVHIVSYSAERPTPFFSIDKNIQLHYLSTSRDKHPVIIRDIRRIIKLRQLYAQLQPDVIILIGTTRSLVNIPASRGYTVVAKEYFSIKHCSQITSYISRRITARYTQGIVTLSKYDSAVYRDKYHANNVVTIANPRTLPHDVLPAELKNTTVLALGRLSYVKGFDLLLQAWEKVQHGEWDLHIVGSGKMEKQLHKYTADRHLQNVKFIPATSDVLPHYRNASVFVLPSRSEAFGNVVMEAMSVGLPVIGFDCGDGVKDLIIDRKTGIIVPPKDTDSMADALNYIINNPEKRKEMSLEALEHVKQYSDERIAGQWEQFLINAQSK